MESNPTPSNDFGPGQRRALALSGTVMLPSPCPAFGRVFIGINPDHEPTVASGSPRFFLKVVQTVSAKQAITWIFGLDELRAVKLAPGVGSPEAPATRLAQPVDEFADQIAYARTRLEEALVDARRAYQLLLFPEAVLFIPEAAPVLVRILYEFGVTAAESVENIEILGKETMACCQDKRTPANSPFWE